MDVPLCASMELLINLDERGRERVKEMERERKILALTDDIQKDHGRGKITVKNKRRRNPGIATVNIVLAEV